MLPFGAAGGEQDPPVGEHRTHAMGDCPSAANRGPTESVGELQALFFKEDLLAFTERQTRNDRSSLGPPHKHDADNHECDDDDCEQRAWHRRT